MPPSSVEALVRSGAFAGTLALLWLWEWIAPRRPPTVARPMLRRLNNLALQAINTAAVRLLVPLAALGTAELAAERGWGVFHQFDWPAWASTAAAVVLLDLFIYGQHVLFHAVPVFWRLHRVHHADRDLDVTSGLRFHTFEILLSMALKMGAVIALGAPPVSVVIFELLLNLGSMFSHANIRLPRAIDRLLRAVIVTPDMHRVHHSIRREETDSNFGFNLSCWDRLLRTYRDQPVDGHEGMTIGLSQFRGDDVQRLPTMLALPFRRDTR